MFQRRRSAVALVLGGHAPVIVCDDVDPVPTAATSVVGKSRNAGQVCVAPTRFFVQETIYEQFAQSFAERASQLKVGNGLDPSTQLGPLANSRRIDAMEALVADAKAKVARVLAGGQRIGNRGYFFPLTVLTDLPDDARAMNEEPFGPLALVNPVKTLDEAIEKANALPYGLAAYAFTRSASNAERLAESVEVGNLSINHFVASVAETPFGGVKDSGYGREGGTEGLQCYTVVKNVSHKTLWDTSCRTTHHATGTAAQATPITAPSVQATQISAAGPAHRRADRYGARRGPHGPQCRRGRRIL